MSHFFLTEFDKRIQNFYINGREDLKELFEKIDETTESNCIKVLKSFQKHNVMISDFNGTTGYGYDDLGRIKLESIFADIFNAEDALVRWQIMSGTHAISLALFGILRPGDSLLYATGKPYDTLHSVIGLNKTSKNEGSLADFNISYYDIELLPDSKIDITSVLNKISKDKIKMVAFQRSKGYQFRNSISLTEIRLAIKEIKSKFPAVICFVDNCYGEFVNYQEPTEIGADIIAGSLIKNAGGGIAPTGGYLAGKKEYVEMAACRLTAPGLGKKIGASLGINRLLYQGLYFAPSVTGEAVKNAILAGYLAKKFGYEISPLIEEERSDIVQAIKFGNNEALIAFCQGIQKGSQIDSSALPIPAEMAGYDNNIIMASGGFIEGSSIEISCDAPIKEPFVAYLQGGLSFNYGQYAILKGFQELVDRCI